MRISARITGMLPGIDEDTLLVSMREYMASPGVHAVG